MPQKVAEYNFLSVGEQKMLVVKQVVFRDNNKVKLLKIPSLFIQYQIIKMYNF